MLLIITVISVTFCACPTGDKHNPLSQELFFSKLSNCAYGTNGQLPSGYSIESILCYKQQNIFKHYLVNLPTMCNNKIVVLFSAAISLLCVAWRIQSANPFAEFDIAEYYAYKEVTRKVALEADSVVNVVTHIVNGRPQLCL